MNVMRAGQNMLLIHLVENGQVVAYLIENGRVADRQVVAYLLEYQLWNNPMVIGALIKAFFVTLAIVIAVAGQVDIAQIILELLNS